MFVFEGGGFTVTFGVAQNHTASMLDCVILLTVYISGSPNVLYILSSWAVFDIPKLLTGVLQNFSLCVPRLPPRNGAEVGFAL